MPDVTQADRAAATVVELLGRLRAAPPPTLAERAAEIEQAASELAIALDRLADRAVTAEDLDYLRVRVDLIRTAVGGRRPAVAELLDQLQSAASATRSALAARTKV
jgi:hypothetical protein